MDRTTAVDGSNESEADAVTAVGWPARMQIMNSPNQDARPIGMVVDTVILHYISLPPEHFSGNAVADLFLNRLDPDADPYFKGLAGVRVSAHYFLRRHGELIQFVHPDRRAWHAGVSQLLGRHACNDFSIGIEIEGSALRPFTEHQYRRLQQLLACLFRRYPIRYIAGHSDVAPGRKEDPGPFFLWERLQPLLLEHGVVRPA
ncbi:MAG: 1,6-anhydro-N-acetylmuramyl-L-alanine amidase AmpD [Lautropia sp.]|nr:1,6-anhydro-N-acetylmuramyl-L-alanine amidase AmpD [Lautropia sp.]